MRFVLFTEKTPSQCVKALNERLQATATKSRPRLKGQVEKSGKFSMALSTPVLGKFQRTTRLSGSTSRESGVTVIRGFVPDGASSAWLIVIGIAVFLLATYMFAKGDLIFAIMIIGGGGALVIPLLGDHRNHDILLYELEKTLKAKPTPPKK